MGNLLADGMAQLAADMDAFASTPCTYLRGSTPASVSMTPCFSMNSALLRGDIETAESVFEFIATKSALPSGAPVVNDTITMGGQTFKVISSGGPQVYRPSDPYGIRIRIYARLIP
jgi:hypothetical protein